MEQPTAEEVVMAPTVNCFKGRFDRHSADNRYSMEWRNRPVENAQLTTIQSLHQLNNTWRSVDRHFAYKTEWRRWWCTE